MSERPILGVGWDVGGWVGGKQGVAALTWDDSRVQWCAEPVTFRLSSFSEPCKIDDLLRRAWPTAPSEVLQTHRVILAIDAPLGFPIAFTKLLNGDPCPEFSAGGREIDNPLAYRATDRGYVWEEAAVREFRQARLTTRRSRWSMCNGGISRVGFRSCHSTNRGQTDRQ